MVTASLVKARGGFQGSGCLPSSQGCTEVKTWSLLSKSSVATKGDQPANIGTSTRSTELSGAPSCLQALAHAVPSTWEHHSISPPSLQISLSLSPPQVLFLMSFATPFSPSSPFPFVNFNLCPNFIFGIGYYPFGSNAND